jgi:anti-sigma factor RsiW
LEQQIAFEETCERYLLGELSEAERAQFEEAYFADDALFERFLAVKDELIDAYARDELAEAKRTRFTQHFLTTGPRRRQLDEAQEFIRAVTAVSTKVNGANAPLAVTNPQSSWKLLADFFKPRPFAWQTALAALLLVTLGGTWVFVRNWQPATPNEQAALQPTPSLITAPPSNENNAAPSPAPANANQSPANTNVAPKSPANTNIAPEPTPKKLPARPPQISPAQIASIILLPVASRDINEANTLRLNSDTRAARLRLAFKSDDYRNYSAAITTIAGANVWQKTLKADIGDKKNKTVTLQFAPALLTQQDYIVTLKGHTAAGQTETIGEYYFHVERSPSQNTQTPTPQP